MRIVTNSSPLIAFAILNQLDLLTQIFAEIYIPQTVFNEISVWGKPYSRQLRAFSKGKVKSAQNTIAVQFLNKDVDLGEAEAIVLALEIGIEDILIDDPKGRKIAQLNGLYPIGTIGVLLEAKNLGYISQIKPDLDKLIANRIRIGKNLYQQALQLADENN
jgi:predicted nucleic acid-binding protein